MEESDTHLAIREEGEKIAGREDILIVGEERFGVPDDPVRPQVNAVNDLSRLKRKFLRSVTAADWQEVLETP
jgi:hypothetical protein